MPLTVVATSGLLTQNEGVHAMSDPQIWSIIGVLTAFVVGTVGLMYKLIDARFESFEAVIVAGFDGVSQRFDGVSQRFDGVDRRLDALESDMSMIKAHLLGIRRPNGA